MPIMDAPAIKEDFGRAIGFVVAILVGNESQVWWRTNKDTAKPNRNAGAKGELVGEEFLYVENAVAVCVFKYLDASDGLIGMGAAVDVVVVFHDPDAATVIEGEGDGFANGGLGGKNTDLKAILDVHLGDGFSGLEEGGVAGAMFLELGLQGKGREEEKERDVEMLVHGIGDWQIVGVQALAEFCKESDWIV